MVTGEMALPAVPSVAAVTAAAGIRGLGYQQQRGRQVACSWAWWKKNEPSSSRVLAQEKRSHGQAWRGHEEELRPEEEDGPPCLGQRCPSP